jgi:hypothetical protein
MVDRNNEQRFKISVLFKRDVVPIPKSFATIPKLSVPIPKLWAMMPKTLQLIAAPIVLLASRTTSNLGSSTAFKKLSYRPSRTSLTISPKYFGSIHSGSPPTISTMKHTMRVLRFTRRTAGNSFMELLGNSVRFDRRGHFPQAPLWMPDHSLSLSRIAVQRESKHENVVAATVWEKRDGEIDRES